MLRVEAILFDFDGTLADTMSNHFFCWKTALQEIGVSIGSDEYYPMEGASLYEIASKFSGLNDKNFLDKIVTRKKQLYIDANKSGELRFYPGGANLIKSLTAKYPIAIVTAGHEDQLRATVPGEFLNLFSTLICGDMVRKNKPSPEPYIRACEKLSKEPTRCVVVENAPLGITAAINAGCYCVGVQSTCNREQLLEANEIIPEISDLLDTKVLSRGTADGF